MQPIQWCCRAYVRLTVWVRRSHRNESNEKWKWRSARAPLLLLIKVKNNIVLCNSTAKICSPLESISLNLNHTAISINLTYWTQSNLTLNARAHRMGKTKKRIKSPKRITRREICTKRIEFERIFSTISARISLVRTIEIPHNAHTRTH